VLVTAGAFTVLLGLVVDGGRVIDSRLASTRTAAQAARSGADALSAASVRNGSDQIAVNGAMTRAERYLHDAGMVGTVRVIGDKVSVTVTGKSTTVILDVIGIKSFPIEETQTAGAINQGATQGAQP
jgi:hypothetical protein